MAQEAPEQCRKSELNLGNNVAWFVTGACIGAAVALLCAPKSGKDTRQYLAGKVQESKQAVTGSGTNVVEAGKDLFERGRQLVDDAAELFERGRKLVKG